MDPTRRTATLAGWLMIITFVTSIGALIFYGPVLKAGYVTGAGADHRVAFGALLEMVLIVANIGTATVLYRSSSDRTKASPSATSPLASLSAASSPLASSASSR